jgi:hypothetical protein
MSHVPVGVLPLSHVTVSNTVCMPVTRQHRGSINTEKNPWTDTPYSFIGSSATTFCISKDSLYATVAKFVEGSNKIIK